MLLVGVNMVLLTFQLAEQDKYTKHTPESVFSYIVHLIIIANLVRQIIEFPLH